MKEPKPEEGYPWPCIQCGKVFTPHRLTRLKGQPMQKCCSTCAWENLNKFLDKPEEEKITDEP